MQAVSHPALLKVKRASLLNPGAKEYRSCGGGLVGLTEVLALIVVAAGAGTLGTMLGLGGGIFLVPILSLVFDVPLTSAIAASAIAVVANSVSGSRVYLNARYTNVRLAYVLLVPTATGAIVGGVIATSIPQTLLKVIFATLLISVAYIMLRRRNPGAVAVERTRSPDPLRLAGRYVDGPASDVVSYVPVRIYRSLPIASLGGVASGMFGIGGGPITVPLMNLVMRMPVKAAASTSSFMVGMTAASSAFIYYSRGHVDPAVTIISMAGIIVGARIGARLASRIRPQLLVVIFVVVLTVLAVSMYLDAAGLI
jgi:uncharacterized protein